MEFSPLKEKNEFSPTFKEKRESKETQTFQVLGSKKFQEIEKDLELTENSGFNFTGMGNVWRNFSNTLNWKQPDILFSDSNLSWSGARFFRSKTR